VQRLHHVWSSVTTDSLHVRQLRLLLHRPKMKQRTVLAIAAAYYISCRENMANTDLILIS
jgi:hypothetical protein